MINNTLITIDIDWATDTEIKKVADHLIKDKVKATWFVTHNSPAIEALFLYPDLFELGIHPNFKDDSTQGDTPEEVMNYLLDIVPQAQSMRSHSLVQSTPLLRMAHERYGIQNDVSLLLPYTSFIEPHNIYVSKNKGLLRVPYFWEDDIEFNNPDPSFTLSNDRFNVNGIKVFNFHPVHISCKKVEDFFIEVIEFMKSRSIKHGLTISDLANNWRSTNESNSYRQN